MLACGLLASLCLLPSSAGAAVLRLETLSNRAGLISGGDALVEVVLPAGTDPAAVRVDDDGRDVTSSFALRGGRFLGLVTGLDVGENVLTARVNSSLTQLVVTNHPIGGPVFAGPQVQPWLCATEANGLGPAQDAQCNAPTKVELFYKSSLTGLFNPYDPNQPPLDLARTTTDQGENVPYVVRRERGVIDRGIYDIAVLDDARGRNGKLVVPFGGGCGPLHGQAAPGNVMDDAALSRGFGVLTSHLNTLGQNCNDVVSAEALMMVKERFVEAYGPVRYTIGNGCSGGSMQQHWIASNYPGLLDGILPSCSYPDVWETLQEAEDCYLLDRYFDANPLLWVLPTQRAAVAGYAAESVCRAWDTPVTHGFARSWVDPTLATSCGLPPSAVYHPATNPGGVRCTLQDYQVALFGRRPPARWGPVEQALGRGFANRPYDNVGVQYGLAALRAGQIGVDQFVDLNEKVGGVSIDWTWQASRSTADPAALRVAYRSGRVVHGGEAAKVPIIDLRGTSNLEIHTDVHSQVMRARLRAANGHADNQVIWTGGVLLPDAAMSAAAFALMDQWLAAMEADTAPGSLEARVLRNKPAAAVDACWILGQKVTDAALCRATYPYFATPRIAAGGPLADDVLKCRLTAPRRDAYGVTFTDAQWARLLAAFPSGVCDRSRPGVAQQPSIPWLSFADGPGGTPLPAGQS